jgi:hypothetical protein
VTGPTLAERGVVPSEPVPEPNIPPVAQHADFAHYPRTSDPKCSKCGAEMASGVKSCPKCGYAPHSPWERAGAFTLLLLSTSCVCCGPCFIGSSDSSGISIILLAALFLGLYIAGWVWYVKRYR